MGQPERFARYDRERVRKEKRSRQDDPTRDVGEHEAAMQSRTVAAVTLSWNEWMNAGKPKIRACREAVEEGLQHVCVRVWRRPAADLRTGPDRLERVFDVQPRPGLTEETALDSLSACDFEVVGVKIATKAGYVHGRSDGER